eukprot:scaffold77491_cov12-Tisochrysis_lutea.AAC.1
MEVEALLKKYPGCNSVGDLAKNKDAQQELIGEWDACHAPSGSECGCEVMNSGAMAIADHAGKHQDRYTSRGA